MCGISSIFSRCNSECLDGVEILKDFDEVIKRRGPTSFDFLKYVTKSGGQLLFAASVLWLQGKSYTNQPVCNEKSVLVYNGDIFGGLSEELRRQEGDTLLFFDLLNKNDDIFGTLSKIQGPYSFIYFNKKTGDLYFGRDIYGRKSLLIGIKENTIILSSVAKRHSIYDFIELPAVGVFCYNIETGNFSLTPWQNENQERLTNLNKLLNINIAINLNKPHTINSYTPELKAPNTFENIQNINSPEAFNVLLNTRSWLKNVIQLKQLLEESVRLRVSNISNCCKKCKFECSCNCPLVGVLFSGGVDCTTLAFIADKFISKDQPIHLMNVSFDEKNNYQTPDRLTGLQALQELKQTCPERNWIFIEINVSQEELIKERRERIADLIYPLNTILDDSLGCALWFASRHQRNTNTSCKVLLAGTGADELFGGYTKHRAAFKRHSWLGLHKILDEDWQNLPYKNLGRDDRVVSDHGRQLRVPYLDENLVEFLRILKPWEKTYPSDSIPQGLGEKILLRSLAYHLGLKTVATFKKRALQFGSRIANNKEKANEVSERLLIT